MYQEVTDNYLKSLGVAYKWREVQQPRNAPQWVKESKYHRTFHCVIMRRGMQIPTCSNPTGESATTYDFPLYYYSSSEPVLVDVVECLIADRATLQTEPKFKDWFESFGFEDSEQESRNLFDKIKRQTEWLEKMFTNKELETLDELIRG